MKTLTILAFMLACAVTISGCVTTSGSKNGYRDYDRPDRHEGRYP